LSDTELLYLSAESMKWLSIAEDALQLQKTKQVSISEDIENSTELLQ